MSYENLHAYQAAEQLRREVDALPRRSEAKYQPGFKHLDESVDSIANNRAEGAESIYSEKRRSFYDIAANSTKEARRNLRSLDRRGGFNGASVFKHVGLTITIAKMVQSLIDKIPRDDGSR